MSDRVFETQLPTTVAGVQPRTTGAGVRVFVPAVVSILVLLVLLVILRPYTGAMT